MAMARPPARAPSAPPRPEAEASGHQPSQRLEHHVDDRDHGQGQTYDQDAEPHLSLRLGAGNAARPRAVRGSAPQLLAAASLDRAFLLESELELGDALAHPHGGAN